MDEPVAVNQITVTKELFEESHAAVFSKRRQKMLLYCGIVFLCFGLVMLLVRLRFPATSGLFLPSTLTGAVVLIWALTLEKSERKKKYRLFRQRNGEASARTITCQATYLTVEPEQGEPVDIDYADITEEKETEHLILLICRDHTGVLLAKDGFLTGSREALTDAIQKAREEAKLMAEAGL